MQRSFQNVTLVKSIIKKLPLQRASWRGSQKVK